MTNSGFGGGDFGRHWARHVDAVWSQHRGGQGGPGWPGGGPGGRSGHGRSGPAGPPPWIAGLFGLGQTEQPRGPRVRRGDVRSAILDVVREAGEREEPVNGYQVIQQIAERSGQEWRPSPGSVYPTIQQLEDEGLLTSDDERGRKSLRLTEAGQAYVVEHVNELAAVWAPFERQQRRGGEVPWSDIKPEIGQVMSAVWQIITNGSDTQRAAAVDVLVETRRKLYGILADGDDTAPTDDPTDDPDELDELNELDDDGHAGESGPSQGGGW